MRPYLQFVGVIFKAPFESRQRRSPDMDEAPSQNVVSEWVRGVVFQILQWRCLMNLMKVFGVRLRWIFPQKIYCFKMTLSFMRVEICTTSHMGRFLWWCPSIRLNMIKQPEGWYPMKGAWFISWEGVQIKRLFRD